MTQPEITNIDNSVLTVEGVLEDIMSQNGPHLWEKQLLEIVNQYDDKNNRDLISVYRKTIKILEARLNKRDDPHMIRLIVDKIRRSYKKRLENALDTLTSTPPSSDDEDADTTNEKCSNIYSKRLPVVNEVIRNVNEVNSVSKTKNCNNIKKAYSITPMQKKTQHDNSKKLIVNLNENDTEKFNTKLSNENEKYKNIQKSEKDSSYGIKKTKKKRNTTIQENFHTNQSINMLNIKTIIILQN